MTPQLATAIVTALGAILVAAFSYLSAKRKERDAEPRKEKLEHYKEFVSVSNSSKSIEKHDALMSKLFYEMRRDLGVSPSDDRNTFKAWLFASGNKPDQRGGA